MLSWLTHRQKKCHSSFLFIGIHFRQEEDSQQRGMNHLISVWGTPEKNTQGTLRRGTGERGREAGTTTNNHKIKNKSKNKNAKAAREKNVNICLWPAHAFDAVRQRTPTHTHTNTGKQSQTSSHTKAPTHIGTNTPHVVWQAPFAIS